jgi:ElaA protein
MLQWKVAPFNNLSLAELYGIMRLRQEVFVVEQNCPFVDADENDQPSFHLSGLIQNELAAYARIVPPGIIYPEPSIGRIVTASKYRHSGYGRQLMEQSLAETEKLFGKTPVRIMAQQYLQCFYQDYGFRQIDEPFLLDNIWHIIMLRQPGITRHLPA